MNNFVVPYEGGLALRGKCVQNQKNIFDYENNATSRTSEQTLQKVQC
jgi:hypothetical protein